MVLKKFLEHTGLYDPCMTGSHSLIRLTVWLQFHLHKRPWASHERRKHVKVSYIRTKQEKYMYQLKAGISEKQK